MKNFFKILASYFRYPNVVRARPWFLASGLAISLAVMVLALFKVIPAWLALALLFMVHGFLLVILFGAVQLWEQMMYHNNKSLKGLYEMTSGEFSNNGRQIEALARSAKQQTDALEELSSIVKSAVGESYDQDVV